MRRILLIVVLALCGTAMSGLSQSTTQIFPRMNSSRRVEVNAKTITPLAPGKNYVVDLTQRGVKYEFNHQAGKIDLRRVRVRTASGEVAIDSFLKTLIPTDMLPRFRYTSQSFSLGTLPPIIRNPSTNTTSTLDSGGISCPNPDVCRCKGETNCQIMLDRLCGGKYWACTQKDGQPECACVTY
jgi:hypothetical protein